MSPHSALIRFAVRIADLVDGAPPQPSTNDNAGHRYALPRTSLQHFPRLLDDSGHPTRWTFPNYLKNPNCPWLSRLAEMYEMPIVFPASLSPEAGLMLHGLVRNARPRVVVETGTFLSISTHWIASALLENNQNASMHCFDDFGPIQPGPWRPMGMTEDRKEWVRNRLSLAGLSQLVTLHKGISWDNLRDAQPQLKAAGGVDFAYIDGDHTIPGAVQDFLALEPVLNTGAFVVVHDTFPELCGDHQGPRYLLDHVNEFSAGLYEKTDLYLSPLNYGMGVLRRIG